MGNKQKKSWCIVRDLIDQRKHCSASELTAESFNLFFTSIATDIKVDISSPSAVGDRMQYLGTNCSMVSFFFFPIFREKINEELYIMKKGNAIGWDEISARVLTSSLDSVLKILSDAINT